MCLSAHTRSYRVFNAVLDTCALPNDPYLSSKSSHSVASLVPTPWKFSLLCCSSWSLPPLLSLSLFFFFLTQIPFYLCACIVCDLDPSTQVMFHSPRELCLLQQAQCQPLECSVRASKVGWASLYLGKPYLLSGPDVWLLEHLCQARGGTWLRPSA